MIYFFAVVLPPLALVMCGKPFQALLNIPLCFLGWLPGVIHALAVAYSVQSERHHRETLAAIRGNQRLR